MKQFRQGDVLLLQENKTELPPDAVPTAPDADRVVLAYGEVTGHAHAIPASAATMYSSSSGNWLEIKQPTALTHEEHSAISLDPGLYRVVRQREYSPRAVTLVRD